MLGLHYTQSHPCRDKHHSQDIPERRFLQGSPPPYGYGVYIFQEYPFNSGLPENPVTNQIEKSLEMARHVYNTFYVSPLNNLCRPMDAPQPITHQEVSLLGENTTALLQGK